MTTEVSRVLAVSPEQAFAELGIGNIIEVGSSAWFAWLSSATSFRFESGFAGEDSFTARKHERDSGNFWYAYRKVEGKLRNTYLGKSESLTLEKMLNAAVKLSQQPPQAKEKEVKSYASECITVEDSQAATANEEIQTLKARLEQAQQERDHFKALHQHMEENYNGLIEQKIQWLECQREREKLQEQLYQLKGELEALQNQPKQQLDYEAFRDRYLASLRLGKQAPEYKRTKSTLDRFIAFISQA